MFYQKLQTAISIFTKHQRKQAKHEIFRPDLNGNNKKPQETLLHILNIIKQSLDDCYNKNFNCLDLRT